MPALLLHKSIFEFFIIFHFNYWIAKSFRNPPLDGDQLLSHLPDGSQSKIAASNSQLA